MKQLQGRGNSPQAMAEKGMFGGREIRKIGSSATIGNSATLNTKHYMKTAREIHKSLPADHWDRAVLERMFAEFPTRGWDSSDIMYVQSLLRERGLL